MKKMLLFMLFFSGLESALSQNPEITGDLMLCPWTNGTASVVNQTYDTYQWYSKYWFTTDPYVAIEGADQASFTYDWYTYDQSLFKVVATIGNQTFESNVIQIDSYAWLGLTTSDELNETVTFDWNTGTYLLCTGGSFNVTVGSPYNTNIHWYRNGIVIPGADQMTYQITEPGNYYVEAAPDFCPNNTSSNEGLPIVVVTDPDCSLGTSQPIAIENAVKIYPNPVNDILLLKITDGIIITDYSIIDATGKELATGQNATQIDVSHLSSGFYFLKLNGSIVKRFAKK